jgi:hypothetical protein
MLLHEHIAAYKPVARQRPRNKRDIRHVSNQRLGKHVPAEGRHTQYSYIENGGVFYVVRAEELKRRQLGQSSSEDSCLWWRSVSGQ